MRALPDGDAGSAVGAEEPPSRSWSHLQASWVLVWL